MFADLAMYWSVFADLAIKLLQQAASHVYRWRVLFDNVCLNIIRNHSTLPIVRSHSSLKFTNGCTKWWYHHSLIEHCQYTALGITVPRGMIAVDKIWLVAQGNGAIFCLPFSVLNVTPIPQAVHRLATIFSFVLCLCTTMGGGELRSRNNQN